jgi:hypothetical protein
MSSGTSHESRRRGSVRNPQVPRDVEARKVLATRTCRPRPRPSLLDDLDRCSSGNAKLALALTILIAHVDTPQEGAGP